MRGLRRTVLGVLATAVTAAGVLAPTTASAAVTAIHWSTWSGSTLSPGSSASVCTQSLADPFQPGQTLVVQVKLGDVWTTKKTFTMGTAEADCVDLVPSDLVPGPGTYAFRAQFTPAPGATVLTASQTYRLAKEASSAWAESPTGFLSWTTTRHRSVKVGVYPSRGQLVELQRRSHGRWVTASRAKAPATPSQSTMTIAVPKRSGAATYRLAVHGTLWSTAATSDRFVMHQSDARNLRYAARARGYIKRFCPATPIYVDSPDVARGNRLGRIGQATGSWTIPGPGGRGELTTRIELRSGLKPAHLRSVALHECAHVLQYRSVVEDRYDREQSRAWQLWRTTGTEGQADCMSYVWTRTTRYLGYVDRCTRTQVTDSKRMWRAYGRKYQSNPYRWTAPGTAAAAVAVAGAPVGRTVSLG